jgi:hypothetical protein
MLLIWLTSAFAKAIRPVMADKKGAKAAEKM